MKYTKTTTYFLAIAMFMFGILKFVNPFKTWYTIQIFNSGLGQLSYTMGITGEIAVGITLFLCLIYEQKISKKYYTFLTSISFFTIIIMMLAGVYVHMHPEVPANVLPLKIKPPYIPVLFLFLAFFNLMQIIKGMKKTKIV